MAGRPARGEDPAALTAESELLATVDAVIS